MRAPPMPFRLALAASLLALAGCVSGARLPSGDDAGVTPADVVGRQCNVDAECGALRCDKVRRVCICLSDESCRGDAGSAARYCNNYTGLCVEEVSGCTSDAACAASEYCDASIRACRPVKGFCEACARSEECGGGGDDCLQFGDGSRACGRSCSADADCPRGAACADAGLARQCMPSGTAATCADFRGCTPDSRAACASDADCGGAADQRCDAARGQCVALVQACPAGATCDVRDHVCVEDCQVDADCAAGLRCVDHACEVDAACSVDADCPPGKGCVLALGSSVGDCRSACSVDAECPLGTTCALGQDGRYRCQGGCTSNAGCALDARCNATTHLCEGPTVGGVRVCQATAACHTCELCTAQLQCASATSAFPYCQACSGNPDCPGGVCLQLADGLACARPCGAGQECPAGFACLGYGGTLADGGINSACVPADRKCAGKCP